MAALSQLVASAFPVVLADMRRPNSQWAENAVMRAFEKSGMIERKAGGATIEIPIDRVKNAGTDVMATTTTAVSTSETDVLGGASYSWAEVIAPINITRANESLISGENEKIDFVKSLTRNAIDSHDDEFETDFFSTSTDGLLGLQNLVPDSGQPNVGSIDGASATYWRNYTDSYLADGSDIEVALTLAYNTTAKGSGSTDAPTLIVSGGDAQAIYEGQLQNQQRWMSGDKGNAGFTYLAFKDARWVFSQKGGTRIYLLSPKHFKLVVARGAFRKLYGPDAITGFAMSAQSVFSMAQFVTANPSRSAVLTQI